jgi:hypothetical protein
MADLQNAAEAATVRFQEAARMAHERLEKARAPEAAEAVSTGGLPAQEAVSSLSWVTAMLLSTAEEALRSRHALAVASERFAVDQLERAQLELASAHQGLDDVVGERESLRKEAAALGSRVRKDGLSTRQRQAKDAGRIQQLTEQNAQLQANLRLSESAWAEERRAEQAAAAQRERNFQAVILRLQQEVDAMAPAAAAAAAAGVAPLEKNASGSLGADRAGAAAKAGLEAAHAAAAASSEEAAALRGRNAELQAQCDRGVALIERLKLRLQQQEKDKEAQQRREGELNAHLRVAQQQATSAQQEVARVKRQLSQLKEHEKEAQQRAKTASPSERALRVRHESEVKVLVSEVDSLQARAAQSEAKARLSGEELQSVKEQLATATEAHAAAEVRAHSAVASAERASGGTVALLKAALSESQRKLQASQRALQAATGQLEGGQGGQGGQATPYDANGAGEKAGSGARHTAPAGAPHLATPSTNAALRVSFSSGTPMHARQASPTKQSATTRAAAAGVSSPATTPGNGSLQRESEGDALGSEQAVHGLGRLRASLLDSLRAERSKLERERALLGR